MFLRPCHAQAAGKKELTRLLKKTLMYCSSALVTEKVELKIKIEEEIAGETLNIE